jgi:sigma-B regulation protein RsbU (phosphoserine phosphatase)
MSRSLIRSIAFSGRTPAGVLLRTNELILKDSQTDLFLSAVYVMLDLESGRATYANAGHNRPLWIRAAHNQIVELMASGIILGAFEDISVEEASVTVAPGDALVLYTDGVTEATNAHEELFGKQRLLDVLTQHQHDSAQAIVDAIMAACNTFTGGTEQTDDITLVVVKRVALPTSPTPLTP